MAARTVAVVEDMRRRLNGEIDVKIIYTFENYYTSSNASQA